MLVERRGAVGVVTLNRPEKLNALNRALVARLGEALRELDQDDAIGAIVLTGAGERAFSAGGDMSEQVRALDQAVATDHAPAADQAATAEQAPAADQAVATDQAPAADQAATAEREPRGSAAATVRACRKPVLAAVRGYAYGGGAVLAAACDIRIAGHDARFKFHGASYGLAPGGATLPRIVGAAKAKELLFTCDEVLAPEALRIGLLNQVVEPEDVLEVTVAMAERIAANSPRAVAVLKETIDRALPIDPAVAYEEAAGRELRRSADMAARFRTAAARVVGPRGRR